LGGEGVIREFQALDALEATLLTERRRHAPRGVQGGGPGAVGCTLLNGAPLPAKISTRLARGDVLRIETPGGGSWGQGRREPQPGDQR
jgi:N-methylhydantoinase B